MKTSRQTKVVILLLLLVGAFALLCVFEPLIYPSWRFRRLVHPGMTSSEVAQRLAIDYEVYDRSRYDALANRLRNYNVSLDYSHAGAVMLFRLRPPYEHLGVVLLSDEGKVIERAVLRT
ncbi:MAG: hypothetical protein JXQ73_09565 [Phycisphaerae bacterium]|nr:hypothetical protein [Phycisphaerae bacterium]